MIRPSTSPITMPFGATTEPYSPQSPHLGTDFAYIPDNKIYAPVDGLALVKPMNGNDGNAIYIQQGNTLYGMLHMSQFLVSNGQQVKAGQIIGIMGDTGAAQGVHLHWAIKQNNQFVDPMKQLKEETVAETHPYNAGDAVNIANDIGYSVDTMKGKKDWNDAYYSSVGPYIRDLRAQIAQLKQGDPDGQKWRNFKKDLGI